MIIFSQKYIVSSNYKIASPVFFFKCKSIFPGSSWKLKDVNSCMLLNTPDDFVINGKHI